jgi:hypothetical protein
MFRGEANLRESWTEYRNRYPHGYGYSQFTEHFRAWRQVHGFRTTPSSNWRVTHILEQDVSELKKWRRSNNRIKWAKSVAILDLNQGTPITILCSKLEKSLRVIKRWRKAYIENGFTPHDLTRVVPQRQRSKGRLILTGALKLSTNQITHFYSEKKNTDEMIKLLDILLEQYSSQRCLCLSWDAASWHVSAKLSERVSELNSAAAAAHGRLPVVKLAPLPASAQFLNVIESLFSGMARAVIHNSDYQSVEECKKAIDNYFAERNEYYRWNPRRAGSKIWGKELVQPSFKPSNNCKDPNWR